MNQKVRGSLLLASIACLLLATFFVHSNETRGEQANIQSKMLQNGKLIKTSQKIQKTAHLFQGIWQTTERTKVIPLTANPLKASKVFRLYNVEMVDSVIQKFKIYVDNKAIVAPFFEGSSIFVEGKSIEIEQLGKGASMLAQWEVVREKKIQFERAVWVANPRVSQPTLIAAFIKETEFVVTLNRTSTGCSNGQMIVSIDGNSVKSRASKVVKFEQGSSLIGSGKIVFALVTGQCKANNLFYGTIKISK